MTMLFPYPTIQLNLHSTVVLLKVFSSIWKGIQHLNLHSTVVLLKVWDKACLMLDI